MTCGYLSLLDTSEISPCLIKSLDTWIKNLLLILYFKIDELEGSWYNRIPSVMQILYKLIGSKYKATCSTFSAHSHLWCMQLVSWYCSTISHTIFHAGNARFSLRTPSLNSAIHTWICTDVQTLLCEYYLTFTKFTKPCPEKWIALEIVWDAASADGNTCSFPKP